MRSCILPSVHCLLPFFFRYGSLLFFHLVLIGLDSQNCAFSVFVEITRGFYLFFFKSLPFSKGDLTVYVFDALSLSRWLAISMYL